MHATWIIYPLIGIPAGLIAGLLGVGGGVVVVPALLGVFSILSWENYPIATMAIATSLATIVFTSLSSIYAHHQHGVILWDQVTKITAGLVFGTLFGAIIAHRLNTASLVSLFALFLVITGLRMITQRQSSRNGHRLEGIPLPLAGGIIGLVSSLFGIGGGSLTVPFLNASGTPMRQAVGIGAACGFPIAVTGTIAFIILGWSEVTPNGTMGYIVWPAWLGILSTSLIFARIGSHLSHRINVRMLRRIFGALLIVVSFRLII